MQWETTGGFLTQERHNQIWVFFLLLLVKLVMCLNPQIEQSQGILIEKDLGPEGSLLLCFRVSHRHNLEAWSLGGENSVWPAKKTEGSGHVFSGTNGCWLAKMKFTKHI